MARGNLKKSSVLAAAIGGAAMVLGTAGIAHADTPITSFTQGDLVILRTGDATNPDTDATTTQVGVYLDEYTPSGTYVGTVGVPQSGQGAITLPGSGDDQHQGVLNLSANGNWLAFAGYTSAVGSPDANADPTVGKAAGLIGPTAASLNTSTPVNSYGAGSANPYIRGAFTNDGTSFWTFGKYPANNATSNGGLAYVNGVGPSATTTTVEGFADWRDIVNVNGQMYGGTGSSSVGNHGPYIVANTVTNGQLTNPPTEPTTNLGNSLSLNTQLGAYPGGQSASALALIDNPGDPFTQNGVNVLYTIGDQSTAGIVKYYFNGTTWVNQNNVALVAGANNVSNPTGLAVAQDPSNPNAVDITITGNNGLYTYVDSTGYNGAIPTPTTATPTFGFIPVPDNEQFRGVAYAPSVPEPATFGIMTAGALGLLARRRRKA